MSPFLSLRPEGEGADVRLLFHNQPTGSARVLSGTAVHVVAIATLLFVTQLIPDRFYRAVLPDRLSEKLVFLVQPGPAGGGGGGNRSTEPPPPARLKGPDEITVPTIAPPEPQLQPLDIESPPERPAIPAQPMAGADATAPGAVLGTGTNPDSRGPGDGGAGLQKGPRQPGVDGGPYRVGSGVLPPRVRRQVDPQYSAEAMRAKVQGAVMLAVVVLPDGSVGDISVIQSLDRTFGLDLKAIEAARQWRFYPGTRQGEPVPVLVNILLEFHLR